MKKNHLKVVNPQIQMKEAIHLHHQKKNQIHLQKANYQKAFMMKINLEIIVVQIKKPNQQ